MTPSDDQKPRTPSKKDVDGTPASVLGQPVLPDDSTADTSTRTGNVTGDAIAAAREREAAAASLAADGTAGSFGSEIIGGPSVSRGVAPASVEGAHEGSASASATPAAASAPGAPSRTGLFIGLGVIAVAVVVIVIVLVAVL